MKKPELQLGGNTPTGRLVLCCLGPGGKGSLLVASGISRCAMLRCQEKTRVKRLQSKIQIKSTYVGGGGREEKRRGKGRRGQGRGEERRATSLGNLECVHVTIEAKGKHPHQQFPSTYAYM